MVHDIIFLLGLVSSLHPSLIPSLRLTSRGVKYNVDQFCSAMSWLSLESIPISFEQQFPSIRHARCIAKHAGRVAQLWPLRELTVCFGLDFDLLQPEDTVDMSLYDKYPLDLTVLEHLTTLTSLKLEGISAYQKEKPFPSSLRTLVLTMEFGHCFYCPHELEMEIECEILWHGLTNLTTLHMVVPDLPTIQWPGKFMSSGLQQWTR
jgi:hypothetical protein